MNYYTKIKLICPLILSVQHNCFSLTFPQHNDSRKDHRERIRQIPYVYVSMIIGAWLCKNQHTENLAMSVFGLRSFFGLLELSLHVYRLYTLVKLDTQ